jgi:hypothetical protein
VAAAVEKAVAAEPEVVPVGTELLSLAEHYYN